MRLYINLTYKGKKVETKQIEVFPTFTRTKTVTISVTKIVQELVKDAINQAIRKLVPAAKLAKRIKKK